MEEDFGFRFLFNQRDQFSMQRFQHAPVHAGGDHQVFLGTQVIADLDHVNHIAALVEEMSHINHAKFSDPVEQFLGKIRVGCHIGQESFHSLQPDGALEGEHQPWGCQNGKLVFCMQLQGALAHMGCAVGVIHIRPGVGIQVGYGLRLGYGVNAWVPVVRSDLHLPVTPVVEEGSMRLARLVAIIHCFGETVPDSAHIAVQPF